MIHIENYLADGANWQARAVLACLQAKVFLFNDKFFTLNDGKTPSERIIYETRVGRYENCREQGYVFSFVVKNRARHYAVYEHRNSDKICVLVAEGLTINTPNVDYMWEPKGKDATKYDYDMSFSYGAFLECADYIIEDVLKWVHEVLTEDKGDEIPNGRFTKL